MGCFSSNRCYFRNFRSICFCGDQEKNHDFDRTRISLCRSSNDGCIHESLSSSFIGTGGSLILIIFGLNVWRWMRNFETLVNQQKKAAVFQSIGYLFFFTASWFLCGEFAPLYLKTFEDRNPPSIWGRILIYD